MANEEHLAILNQGVEAWNTWRQASDVQRPDLTRVHLHWTNLERADLFGADLRGAVLRWVILTRANLERAFLTRANLEGAFLNGANLEATILEGANLFEADLTQSGLHLADLEGADLEGAILEGAKLTQANLTRANLTRANLYRANLDGANLDRANLDGANLDGANLDGAHFPGANLYRASLSGANLEGAFLSGANLQEANLTGANLTGANLTGAILTGAFLEGAILHGATLTRTNLQGAILTGADLAKASIGSSSFTDVDLSSVLGLETINHIRPSEIGINTLYRSQGKIPEVFLRGCGVPDSFIEYLPALIGAIQPLQFYSCFISYSSQNEDFAKRLHERMRREHMRVWFAPEDLKGGNKLHEQLEQAIQMHDRLLLVLSENSIESEWVATEIYNARQVEQKEQRRKLFPIRLCSFETLKKWKSFDADSGKDIAREVREYFIPDFSNWKDHDAFEAAFARLLHDLRAPETLR